MLPSLPVRRLLLWRHPHPTWTPSCVASSSRADTSTLQAPTPQTPPTPSTEGPRSAPQPPRGPREGPARPGPAPPRPPAHRPRAGLLSAGGSGRPRGGERRLCGAGTERGPGRLLRPQRRAVAGAGSESRGSGDPQPLRAEGDRESWRSASGLGCSVGTRREPKGNNPRYTGRLRGSRDHSLELGALLGIEFITCEMIWKA